MPSDATTGCWPSLVAGPNRNPKPFVKEANHKAIIMAAKRGCQPLDPIYWDAAKELARAATRSGCGSRLFVSSIGQTRAAVLGVVGRALACGVLREQ